MRAMLRALVQQSQLTNSAARRRRANSLSCGVPEILETRALLAAQIISSDAPFKIVAEGETVDIPVNYQTSNDNGAAAAIRADVLNFNLHFDTDALSLVLSDKSLRKIYSLIQQPHFWNLRC